MGNQHRRLDSARKHHHEEPIVSAALHRPSALLRPLVRLLLTQDDIQRIPVPEKHRESPRASGVRCPLAHLGEVEAASKHGPGYHPGITGDGGEVDEGREADL